MKTRVLSAVGAFCLQAALILAVLFAVTFDRAFYTAEYQKLGVYDSCGADSDTLELATDIVLDYLRGTADGMSGTGVIDGETRDIFGEDERMHMADVKGLFELALVVILTCGIIAIVCMIAAGRGGNAVRKCAAQGALTGMGVFAVLLGAAVAWFAVDFSGAFTAFHHLLFRNGLWLMDPDTQFMIRMFPAQFFADMGLKIAEYTGMAVVGEAAVICIAGFGRGKMA